MEHREENQLAVSHGIGNDKFALDVIDPVCGFRSNAAAKVSAEGVAGVGGERYREDMPTPLPTGFGDAGQLLDEEDEATLAAIDRAVESADAGRLRPASEARDVLEQCRTASSTPKKP